MINSSDSHALLDARGNGVISGNLQTIVDTAFELAQEGIVDWSIASLWSNLDWGD